MSSPAEAAAAFETFAAAEGANVPFYARLCTEVAARPDAHRLLLEAPVGQRLPVLLLAALHDVVLADPSVPIAPWYPSAGGDATFEGDLGAALSDTISERRSQLVELLRTRRVQTNEVNRCVGWHLALGEVCGDDDRPIALVEVGASAGLNLRLDDYAYELDGSGGPSLTGRADSTVRLASRIRGQPWQPRTVPPIVHAVGIDVAPLDLSDPGDARWLEACVWPEQQVRFDRLRGALRRAAASPPEVRRGDAVADVADAVRATPHGCHVVVLSSWVLVYLERSAREAVLRELRGAARDVESRGGRLTLLTLEADHVLGWVDASSLPDAAPAELRHSSMLAATYVGRAGVDSTALARTQAHLAWVERCS